jgi:hydroxylysine kinase
MNQQMSTQSPPSIDELLTTTAPMISGEKVRQLAQKYYALSAVVQGLTSERDRNFHLKADDGNEYLLKITNPAESREVTDFQTQAQLHIAAVDPALPVPHLVKTVHGETGFDFSPDGGAPSIVRLFSFLPGVPLHQVARTATQRRNLGAVLARLDVALRGFSHPAAGRELLWDIKHANRLRKLLAHIEDARRRSLAEHAMTIFEDNVLPNIPKLRAQVIHNDLNPYNVLVDPADHDRVAGILDFGDMVHAPLVNDVAVGAAYQLSDAKDPLDTAAEFIAGYHAIIPLEPVEIDLLPDLIVTRLLITVAITGWRAECYPENRAYILRNNPLSWAGIERFADLPRRQATQALQRACQSE